MSDRDVIAEPACRRFDQEYGPKRPGRRRAMLLSLLFAILLGTGLHLEFLAARNWNSGEIVLWAHIVVGLGFLVAFLPWIGRHVARGLDHSQRPFFVWISWLLLATYVVLIVTGLMMVLPTAIFLGGGIWLWRFETTAILTFLHLWSAFAAAAGLLLHLALRHWKPVLPAVSRGIS
jgi:hypothetical protein